MKTRMKVSMATLWVVAIGTGCGGTEAAPAAPSGPAAGTAARVTTGVMSPPSAGGAPAAVSGNAGAAPRTGSGTGGASPPPAIAAGSGAAGGTGPSAGTGAAAPSTPGAAAGSGGMALASAGASAAGTGAPSAAGSGGAPAQAPLDGPKPVSAPLVWGFGLGITDVPAATKFYTDVMKMTVEKDALKRDDRTETLLYGSQAMRGARLALMKFDDMRNTRKITAKLVWQAQNAAAVNAAAAMYPDYQSRLNIGIVQFDGPDTYIQEVGSSFDDGGAGIMEPYMVALGFATSEQAKTISFWEMAFGMMQSPLGTFTVTDATGTGSISEVTLQIPTGGGSALVPQAWTPMRNAKDNPVKVVLFVPDAKASADKVMAAGGTIVQPAGRSAAYDNRLLIVAKDPDGYLVEVVQ